MIERSFDDLVIDKMVLALEEFAAEAAEESVLYGFNVERDRTRPPDIESLPLINIWLESITPNQEGSSGRLQCQETARFNIDCYARGIDTNDDDLDDQKAIARLYYLKEQVRYALFSLINHDFDQDPGKIAKKHWPSWQPFQNDLKMPETEVVAGRWTIEIDYSWAPSDSDGETLDSIAVYAEKWAALYEYGGY
jgi:hypothetical protein